MRRQELSRLPIAGRTFDRDDALPRRRQHFRDWKFIGNTTGEADALEPGARHDQRIRRADRAAVRQPLQFPTVELADAGVGGAAIVDHLDVGKQPPRIGGAPHGIGADLESPAARSPEIVDRKPGAQHQNVVGGIARQRRADHQPRGVFIAGHILERMHRRMQFARPHRVADLGYERAALAAMRQQLAGLVGIACGLELDDLDIGAGRGQAAGNFRGLGKRHDALARSDPDSNCHRYAPFDAP